MNKPVIGMIIGDAAGIGPEIVVKTLAAPAEFTDKARILIIGDSRPIKDAERFTGLTVDYTEVEHDTIKDCTADIMLLDSKNIAPEDYNVGELSAACGKAVTEDMYTACKLFGEGLIKGITFAPFSKAAIRLNRPDVASELELFRIYAEELGLEQDEFFCEVNAADGLWTTRVTSHIPLTQLGKYLTKEGIVDMIRLAGKTAMQAKIAEPKIAVCAINPHAGENGMCGDEEITLITPAIEQTRAEGFNVTGPIAADMIFPRGFNGEFHVIVTMYHDQGQIALKLRGIDKACTLLAGLPMPVGTTAHGTGFDIYGKGLANIGSFCTALNNVIAQSLDA